MRKAGRGGVTFPRIPLMHAEVRCDVEDTRPFGGAWENHGSSCMVGAIDRDVRVQVGELYRSEELATGQAYDVAYLTERAGAPSFFNFECAFELKLQGSTVSVSVRVASRLCKPPDDSGPAPRVDHEMKANSGECDAENNEDQEITVHWVYRSPPSSMQRALPNGSRLSCRPR